tara:strand:- start:404 stop:589 length:186 start_codon:yes stop_codon:yes gene_type:complete
MSSAAISRLAYPVTFFDADDVVITATTVLAEDDYSACREAWRVAPRGAADFQVAWEPDGVV